MREPNRANRFQGWLLLALAGVILVLAPACDDGDGEPSGTATPASRTPNGSIHYGSLSGSLDIDGSSTVFPITQAVAEEFHREAGDVRITVGLSGTGGGFEKFCRGDIQVADASRRIRNSEIRACAEEGIDDILEIEVAIDALTVVVNPDNDWAECMTTAQLHQAFVDGGAKRWSDLDSSWPDEEIDFYYPGADSGTFDYFVEAIIEGAAPEGEPLPAHRADGTSSEDDNILVAGVEGDEYAIGYFGFAYFQETGEELKAVQIDDGEGCVEPSAETAASGDYAPLSRPLYIYTTETILKEKEHVLGFIQFYLDHMSDLAAEVGYVALPKDRIDDQRSKIAQFLP